MAIKSRSLLPRDEIEIEDELDPEDELIQRLIEYRRFKGAAEDFEQRHAERAKMHERGYRREVHDNEPERTLDLGELTAWDLLATFSRLMRETLANRPHQVRGDTRPLRWFVRELGSAVQARPRQTLRELILSIDDEPSKEGLIGAFCALLELMRLGVVTAEQPDRSAEIEGVRADEMGSDLDSLIGASRLMGRGGPERRGRAASGLEKPASEEKLRSLSR